MTTEADVDTHRHQRVILGYGYTYAADDIIGEHPLPSVTFAVFCEALEPWHDPHTELVEVEVEEGADWAVCPECREHFRVDQ